MRAAAGSGVGGMGGRLQGCRAGARVSDDAVCGPGAGAAEFCCTHGPAGHSAAEVRAGLPLRRGRGDPAALEARCSRLLGRAPPHPHPCRAPNPRPVPQFLLQSAAYYEAKKKLRALRAKAEAQVDGQ